MDLADITVGSCHIPADTDLAARRRVFIGRTAELSTLNDVLEDVRGRNPRLVLIDGPPGMGKTALIQEFARIARAPTVLHASGEETEMQLAFGIIGQFASQACVPATDDLSSIDNGAGTHADPLVVGRAFLDLIGRVQQRSPVVLLIDDVQWADNPSLSALTFAFRRLRVDQVLMVVSTRDIADPRLPGGLRRLVTSSVGLRMPLSGLDAGEVRNFCSRVGNVTLTPEAAARLRDHTGGVPIHLHALVEELPAAALRDPGVPLPAPRSLAALVTRRLEACPTATRQLVIAAALMDSPCPTTLAGQLSGLDDPLGAIDGAVGAGLLEEPRPGTIGFPHPLIKAAVYHGLGSGQRARMHSRAADLIQDQTAALRHRVAAAGAGDPALAAEVGGLARAQAAAGNWRTAAGNWRTAGRLYLDRAEKDRCVLEAADCLLQAGELAEASALRAELECCPDGPWRHYLLGHLSAGAGQLRTGARYLQAAWADCDREGRPGLAARIAAVMARVASLVTPGRQAMDWADRALRTDERTGHAANALDLLMLSLGHAGYADWALDLAGTLTAPQADGRPGALDGLMASGALRSWTDDLHGAIERLSTTAEAYRRYGPADFAVTSCMALAEACWRAGNWDDAVVNGELAVSLADSTEQQWLAPLVQARAAYPYIGRGQWEQAELRLGPSREPGRVSEPYPAVWAWETEGFLALAKGEAGQAAAALAPLHEVTGGFPDRLGNQPGVMEWRDNYADALTMLGRFGEADEALRPLEDLGRLHARRSALVAAARARGTLQAACGQRETAEKAFQAGLDQAHGLQRPFSVARLELAFGCFLRRSGRRADASAQLESARRKLLVMQAAPWLAQCERELAACGRASATASVRGPRLTSQELAVSRLAAEGFTNQQIAVKLVLSVKTIEYHLSNVYAKLGVRSRTQLARRLTL